MVDLISRREFVRGASAAVGSACFAGCLSARSPDVCPAWERGHLQIHMIYTGTAESFFLIFPDGTSMLMDCGDSSPSTFRVQEFGRKDLPVLPSADRRAGEWIARYVARVNPHGRDVDYMLLTHFHADHSGSPKFGRSGFLLAAETLRFKKAIDRGWPNYDDPLPYGADPRWMGGSLELMKKTYALLSRRDGLVVEKFAVGERGQVSLLHDPGAFPDFSVFNICGNGKVALKDGRIVDCYAHEHAQHRDCVYNENAMSVGVVVSYGDFKFFNAGDFTASDGRKGEFEGRKMDIEEILALACGEVSVAKANHHAGWSCPTGLVAALRPRVWLAPVWWQLQCDRDTMMRLSSRTAYPGDRLLLPGVLCEDRRKADVGCGYLADVPSAARTPSHVVIDVPPGGRTYTVSCLDPTDETCRVKASWRLESNLRTRDPRTGAGG